MPPRPRPEERARANIDQSLDAAGWDVQDYADLNLGARRGVAVREYPLRTGFADYLLFVDRKAVGVVEAKAEGSTLSGLSHQSEKYSAGLRPSLPAWRRPLPFLYESTGIETQFTDGRDPEPRSRGLFAFHRPETLAEWVQEAEGLRARLRGLPPLVEKVNLDIFWLRDESLEDSANLPAPDIIAAEIAEDLRAALEQFEAILAEREPAEGGPEGAPKASSGALGG